MAKVIILGAGESGVGAAGLAQRVGDTPFVSDYGQVAAQYRAELKANGIAFEEGGHSIESFFDAEVIIKSPGIPDTVPVVRQLKARGLPVISEIEYAFRHTDANILAITGSNGKTTTTSWVYHVMKSAGMSVEVGGNIGESFARLVANKPKPDWYVLEVSSFQLDNVEDFRPEIGLLLNITPDHLDRYEGSMDAYGQAKFRLAMNQGTQQVWIYQGTDPEIQKHIAQVTAPQKRAFGLTREEGLAAWVQDRRLVVCEDDRMYTFETVNMQLLGPHNQLNALAVALATRAVGCSVDDIQRGLDTFSPIAHRLEPVGTLNGVSFINDSKATNVDAVKYALQALDKPVVWMAGGVDKGNDYAPLKELVREKVKAIVFLGAYELAKFEQFFSDKSIYPVDSMETAIEQALSLAENGDQVLLSPACASFDLFDNYEDRGDQFRSAVQKKMLR